MTAKKKSSTKKKRTHGFLWHVSAACFWFFLILVILYSAALLLSRTEGFRSILEEQIAEHAGVDFEITRSALDWKLNLHLDDITSGQEDNTDSPFIEILHVSVDWSLFDGGGTHIRNLVVAGAQIRLVQDDAGLWQPAVMAPLADKVTRLGQLGAVNLMMQAERKPGVQASVKDKQADRHDEAVKEKHTTPTVFEEANVTIDGAAISWWSHHRKIAGITGLDFVSRIVQFPGRNFQYYKVVAACAELGQTRRIDNISFEMLSTQGRNIVLGPKADWKKKLRAKKKAPVEMDLDDEMTETEKAILAEAEAVLNREPIYEEVDEIPMRDKVSAQVVVEEEADVRTGSPPDEQRTDELDTTVIEEDFNIAAFDDLSEDESEALVEYIQEMLEIDPANMGSDYD